MRGLVVIWLGQMISGTATSITTFALFISVFGASEESGTAIGLWEFFFFGSYLVVVQFAGVFIDRYDRKSMMLVYDFLALTATAVLLAFQITGRLEIWHLYVASVFQGIGFAFQTPSYSAAIATMIPRKNLIRANGLMSLLNDAPEVFGPVLAGMLYLITGLTGILALNLMAFVISIAALLLVEIPKVSHTEAGRKSQSEFFKDTLFGIRYIFMRPGLLGLQLIFFFGNLFSGIALSVAAFFPMILLRTGDTQAVGAVQSAGALAAVAAGAFLSTLGGIKRPIHAILMGWILSSLFGLTLLGVGQVLTVWLVAVVINAVFEPVVNVSMETFLQTKIPPELQGRVFSASDFMAQLVVPIAPLLAGLLGDRIFEPVMSESGALADTFGWLVGTGPGSGFGLLIVLCGVAGTLIGLSGYLVPSIRNVDKILPDYVPLPPVGMVKRTQPRKTETVEAGDSNQR